MTKEIEEVGYTFFHKLRKSYRDKIQTKKCVNCKAEFKKQNVVYATLSKKDLVWWCAKHPSKFPHLLFE